MNKKNEVLTNLELSSFCKQMSMILKAGISPIEGISMMIEDSQNENEKQLPIEHTTTVDKIIEYVPDVMEKANELINKCNKKDSSTKKEKIIKIKRPFEYETNIVSEEMEDD